MQDSDRIHLGNTQKLPIRTYSFLTKIKIPSSLQRMRKNPTCKNKLDNKLVKIIKKKRLHIENILVVTSKEIGGGAV